VDNASKFSLAGLQAAMGLPANLDLQGRSAHKTATWLEDVARQHPGARFDAVTDLRQVETIVQHVDLFQVTTSPVVLQNSDLRWITTPDGFVLWLPNRECMRIRKNLLDHYDCIASGQKFAEAPTLREAFVQADGWVKKSRGAALAVVSGKARWLDDPASPKQLAVLRRRMGAVPGELTKGEASTLIGRLVL
jgi:hypothetical protein